MILHGVEESEYVKLSNMKYLYQELQKADRVISY